MTTSLPSAPRGRVFHPSWGQRPRSPLRGVAFFGVSALRQVGWTVVLLSVALVGCRKADSQQEAGGDKPFPVEVMELQPGPVRDTSEYLGTLISRSSVDIFPQVSGYVQRILVRPGQRVKEGQLLLVVDPRQEAAGLRSAQAQLASALSNRELARANRKRYEPLFREGVVSRQDYDQIVAQAEAAEAAVRAAQAQVEAQKVQLGFHEVTAPFAGVVGDIPVKLGDYVSTETLLTRVDQSRALEVSVSVPVEQARRVRSGRTPLEVLDADGKVVVSAPVFFVAPTPNARTQLVELKAAFENTVGLRAGQVVRARVVYETREALRLPTYAVVRQSGQEFALVVAQKEGGGSAVHLQPVELGQVEGNTYEVKSGLQPGMVVAVGSVQMLRDGQPVEPRPVKEEAEGGKEEEGRGVGGGADAGR